MWSAPIVFPFGLHNAAATAGHLVALRMVQPPADNEFMGVIEHDAESLHRLLTEEPGSSSSSDSSRGSHHPFWECFMAKTPEGHIESVSGEEATLTGNPNDRIGGEAVAPSRVRMEQLRAWKLEIDEAGQGLVREYADINREIECRENGGRARTTVSTKYGRQSTEGGACGGRLSVGCV